MHFDVIQIRDIDGSVEEFVNNFAILFAVILNLQLISESDIIYEKIIPE